MYSLCLSLLCNTEAFLCRGASGDCLQTAAYVFSLDEPLRYERHEAHKCNKRQGKQEKNVKTHFVKAEQKKT